jgi:hypothetical protein
MTVNIKKPTSRKLRAYAFDPSLSLKMDTAGINNITYSIPWEDNLAIGPIGEYIEVIDYDPTIGKFYEPLDLNLPYLLAQNGLEPSESNPQFHQQMVYAVAMTTIKNFEAALGRQIFWSPYRAASSHGSVKKTNAKKGATPKHLDAFVKRLRIYPHAFRDANAYYSPQKKALLFGYFSAQPPDDTLMMQNSLVFTCLSHDVIAHEITHAILDGIYGRYTEPTNPDVLAFHEAFADIVALFQHFTFPEVLKNQIAKTNGELASQNLLGQLAQEFGTAIGNYGALRDAIGYVDAETKQWKVKEPDGNEYRVIMEPHSRGAILVAAIFEAFLSIYKNRIADLLRIATGGSGILPKGELHPDLINRLADEAAKTAGHVLKMCIRALDYCPPVDITFGDYLRAIITADIDLIAEDSRDYRLAFIDAFRKRGIYPEGIKNLSIQSLSYNTTDSPKIAGLFKIVVDFLRDFREDIIYETDREVIHNKTVDHIVGREVNKEKIFGLHKRLKIKFENSKEFELITGLMFSRGWDVMGVRTSNTDGISMPSFEIQSLKLACRVGPTGFQSNQVILTLIQRAGIKKIEENGVITPVHHDPDKNKDEEFEMQSGCTMIFDLDTLKLKYAITKPLLDLAVLKHSGERRIDLTRARRIGDYIKDRKNGNTYEAYFGLNTHYTSTEPFAFLHNH